MPRVGPYLFPFLLGFGFGGEGVGLGKRVGQSSPLLPPQGTLGSRSL